MKFYIIKTGCFYYTLYECKGIKLRIHVYNLDKNVYDRIAAKKYFKRLINVIHPNIKYSLEYKG